MAEQTVDQILDGGASCLQYFKEMLDLAKRISAKNWPDWRDHVCRNYDNERGIDLASLRGDAVMLRQQATAARQAATDQSTARTSVQTGWPDNAGRAAVTTLNAHQNRSEPTVSVLEKTATAAEAVPDAVVGAVSTKVSALSEFNKDAFGVGDVGLWNGVKAVVGVGLSIVTPAGIFVTGDGAAEAIQRFEKQLAEDLARFDRINAAAVSSIQATYATVPAAAKGIDASAFPAPSFGSITGTTTEKPGGPTTVSPVSGGGGGGGSPTTSSPSSTTPTTTSPTTTSPTSTSPTTTSPTSTSPTSTSPTTPTSTSPSATTPSSATPSAGTGTGKDSGSSWLSQLLPKIAEQLGLGDKDKSGDGKDSDEDGKDGKDADKDAKGEKVLGTDALGRTVTATLSPDGKTVEVTAKKPDGTTEKVTLKVGEDGKLTPVDAEDGAGKDEAGKGGAGKDGAGNEGDAKPDGTTVAGKGGGATPSVDNGATTPTSSENPTGSGAGATPSGGGATPSAAGPGIAAPPAAPAKPSNADGQNPAPAEEPCPPEALAGQGTGAEFAVSGT